VRRWAAAVAAVLLLAAALPAAACPVCFGEAEGEVIEGTQWSVAFLGALVYGLLGGAGALVLVQRRRLRRQSEQAADPHHGLRLVPGEGAAPAAPPAARPETDPPSDPPSKPAVEE
jgi:hypothetical protein